MARTDSLVMGAIRAVKGSGGSYKTQYNHLRETKLFVQALREVGYGVQQWKNLSNKHVGAVVDRWKAKGLKAATIKEYLSGVRVVTKFFDNPRIAPDNARFGIENRVYVTNIDKAVPRDVYEKIVNDLKASTSVNDHRVAAQLQLQRELGLRREESFKFHPVRAVLQDGRVHISDGTKGGRSRIIEQVSERGQRAIDYAKKVMSGKNTMPPDKTERQWNGRYSRTVRAHGLTKNSSGYTSHGLRHAYAQERYAQLSGFEPRAQFDSQAEFRAAAEQAAGPAWKGMDRDARLQLKTELGHGPDRDDVVSQYIGSSAS